MIRTAIKLGLFGAVCLGFTLALAFRIGNIHPFQDTYQLSASFDDVTGLLVDDNVKIAGVVVGKVTGIDVDHGRAAVSFEVHDDVRVPTDSSASVRWRNLLGQRYLYLEAGSAATVLRDGDLVAHTTSVVHLGDLFNRLGPIVSAIDPEKVNQFLETTVAALSGNETDLRQTIADLGTLTATLAERDDAIQRLVSNLDTVAGTIADREAQIRTMLDNLVVIASTFSANTDVLDEAITELGDFSELFGGLLSDNRAEVDSIIASLDVVVEVVKQKLPTLDHAVANLDDGANKMFRSSRHGTWLNQIIPCGAIGPLPLDDSCVTGTDQTGPPQEPTGPHASGAAAIARMLGVAA